MITAPMGAFLLFRQMVESFERFAHVELTSASGKSLVPDARALKPRNLAVLLLAGGLAGGCSLPIGSGTLEGVHFNSGQLQATYFPGVEDDGSYSKIQVSVEPFRVQYLEVSGQAPTSHESRRTRTEDVHGIGIYPRDQGWGVDISVFDSIFK